MLGTQAAQTWAAVEHNKLSESTNTGSSTMHDQMFFLLVFLWILIKELTTQKNAHLV